MANQQNSYTGSQGTGTNNADFAFTFPSFTTSEVKVEVDNVVKTLTTHYTVENYNTTSGGTVRFTTNNIPTGTTPVRIFRQTDVDSPKATFTAGSSLKAGEINDNFKQVRHALQETIGALATNRKVQRFNIEADAIDGTLIADDVVDSEHYVAGSIDLEHMSANSVGSSQYVDGSIDHVHLANDVIDGDNIQDDVINSEHYVALSIDTEHIANEQVTTAKLGPDAVTSAKLADNAVDSEHYVDGSIDHVHLSNDCIDGDNIQNDVINSEHYVAGSIDHEHLANDIIDGDNIQDSVINSEHYVDYSIDHEHLATDIIDGDNIQDDVINSEHIAAGALDNEHYAAGSITSDKLSGATVITASEQASATANDTSFLTSAAADARFFNVSTGDTIKDGDTFPDNDTTIATTAAINDRIIDLVDDVGGFVPIANETSFPTANPDVNNGAGTLVSIKAISSSRTPSSGTVTIANGAGTGNTVTITGCGSTVLSAGFGVIVETTTTLHTYAFHRLVPKATEVTTVAGKATEIGRLGTAAAVEDMSILGTTDVVADMNLLGTTDVVADMNMLATSDVISDMNTLAVTSVINNMDTVATNVSNVNTTAGSISNVNTTAGSISNVNTVAGSISNVNTTAGSISNVNAVGNAIANVNTTASNIASVNNFANVYRIASSDPGTNNDEGDLYFNTTSNELRVYNGSSWQGGVTATGNLAGLGANTFTGAQTLQGTNPKIVFTDTDHNPDYSVQINSGIFKIHDETAGVTRFQVNNTGSLTISGTAVFGNGIDITGNLTLSGTADGRDLAADGTKLDGIETGATADQTASDIKTLFNSSGLVNAQIDASAAIAGTKISPDFGSQNIATTGTLSTGQQITLTGENPRITFTDTNHNPDFEVYGSAGKWNVYDSTNGINQLVVNNNGHVDVASNLNVGAGVDVTGNITVTGLVDGRDVAADGTKLDGIESGATADQTASDIKTLLQSDKLTTSEIGTNAVSSGQINDNAVDSNQIKSDAVVTSKIAALSITTNRIANDAVTADKLADTSVTAGSYGSATAIPAITIDAQGRITAASTNSVNTTTNLSTSTATGSVTVNSSTGNNATISEATSSAAGVMSTAHHDKLDGIEAGATGDQSANEILTAIKTVDGAGSGLDADTLDGINSGSFLRSDTTDNFSALTCSTTGVDDLINFTGASGSDNRGISFNDRTALSADSSDGYLRLNSASEFSNGVYTPGDFRANGAIKGNGGTTIVNSSGQLLAARLTGALPAIDGSALTGIAAAKGGGSDKIFWENGTNVTQNYTITNGYNAMSAGPIQINSGVTVTVGAGETWTVV